MRDARIQQAQEQAKAQDGEAQRLDGEIADAQRRVANLTDAISQLGLDDDLASKFRLEKVRLQDRRDQRAARKGLLPSPQDIPLPTVAEGYLRELLTTLEGDPERAAKAMNQYVGEILMTPTYEGDRRYYLATGGLDLSVALGSASRDGQVFEVFD